MAARKIPLRQQRAFKRLRELLRQTGQHDLLWYYRVGECVQHLFPSEGGRQYGKGRMLEIATALDRPEKFANALWLHRDFFAKYDRSEVKWLCNTDNTGGFQLTWTHVKHLLSLDATERLDFQNNCINAGWPSKELHRAIKDYRGHKSAGGKPFDRPKTLDAGLRQIIDASNAWIRRHRQVWFDADRPVIRLEAQQENPEQIPDLLHEAVRSWEEMAWLAKEYLPRLQSMEKWFRKVGTKAGKTASAKKTKTRKR